MEPGSSRGFASPRRGEVDARSASGEGVTGPSRDPNPLIPPPSLLRGEGANRSPLHDFLKPDELPHQLERDLGRAVAFGASIGLGIVAALQHGALPELLAAHDDGNRAGRAALLGVDVARRDEVYLALRAGGHRGEPDLGVAGLAAVIEAVVALEALGD